MEGNKQVGSSASFTSELFGSKEPSSSTGIFGSIFSTSSEVVGREVGERKQDPANGAWNTKLGNPDDSLKSEEGGNQSTPNKDMSSIYQEQRVQPCHLSSSIYYGGQDIYNHPQSTQSSSLNSMFKKDGTEDDTGSASRGNWWKGIIQHRAAVYLLFVIWKMGNSNQIFDNGWLLLFAPAKEEYIHMRTLYASSCSFPNFIVKDDDELGPFMLRICCFVV